MFEHQGAEHTEHDIDYVVYLLALKVGLSVT